jgi:hypothetical protein
MSTSFYADDDGLNFDTLSFILDNPHGLEIVMDLNVS